ncbi:MAG: hypothetical protein ACREKS_18005 [Candidatus Rokuibacteriota bacterium]
MVPAVMSLIVVTIIFQRIYEPNAGLLNTFLRGIGLDFLTHPWLGDSATALPAVIAVSVWKNIGFSLGHPARRPPGAAPGRDRGGPRGS